MPTPAVTRRHLEQAWLEATGTASVVTPTNWNSEIVRAFINNVPTVASVILAAAQKRFRNKERAAIAQWTAAWLHRAYQLAGAQFSPLSKDDLVGLLTQEQEYLVRLSSLNHAQMGAAEGRHMNEIPNGRLMEMVMQLWGRACAKVDKRGEDPVFEVHDTYSARLHLMVILLALNLSSDRAK